MLQPVAAYVNTATAEIFQKAIVRDAASSFRQKTQLPFQPNHSIIPQNIRLGQTIRISFLRHLHVLTTTLHFYPNLTFQTAITLTVSRSRAILWTAYG